MILSIVIGIALIVGLFYLVKDIWWEESIVELALLILLGIVIWAGIMAVVCLAFGGIGYAIPEHEQNIRMVHCQEIQALKDNNSIEGRFYLGNGHIGEEQYYYYIVNTEKGYKTEKVKSNNAYVVYNDKPYVEKYEAVSFKHWYTYIYAIPATSYYVLYVPEGTITNEFNIDLE